MASVMSSVNVEVKKDEKVNQKTLLRSSSDRLDYKYLVLNNGLNALLVSDSTFANIKTNTNIYDGKSDSDYEDCTEDDLTDVSSCDECEEQHNISDDEMGTNDIKYTKRSSTNEKISAVAVCVKSGSFDDPKQVQGLAHLVEHVITMGSEKYPEENSLDDFLNSRGGYQNAQTEYEFTLFEVEVQRNHFYEALKRLAHCFISPLLRPESIDREIKPIDTEFNEALPDDEVRLEQLISNFANEGHPLKTFTWGNSLTLKTNPEKAGINVLNYVKEFVGKHYVSNNINVVIQSQESIETLEKWVIELFSQIKPSVPNNQLQRSIKSDISLPFANNPYFNRLFLVEPINEIDQLMISWSLPPVVSLYRTSPLEYLGSIVGHEGKGSLISYLRKQNLALELLAGCESSGFHNNRFSSIFQISIKLTELGHKNIDKVVAYVFEYLNVLQTIGPQEWFFEEVQNIELNKFNWQEVESAVNYVKRLAINSIYYPIEHVLCGNKLYFDYDKSLIQKFLNLLTPNNANFVHLCNSILKTDDKEVRSEEWMGTRFKICEVPSNWLTPKSNVTQSNRFHFPNPNPYIATDFSIKEISFENETLYPSKVSDKSRLKLWYKFDDKFKYPKAIIKLHLISPYFRDSVQSAVMVDLFIDILAQNLSEEVFDAVLAGLEYSVTKSSAGIVVSVNGFNHKLNNLLLTILNKMINFEVEDEIFNDVKNNLSKTYHNIFIDPNNLNKILRLSILCEVYHSPIDKRHIIHTIDKQMLIEFVNRFFSNFYIESLIQGNFTKQESIDLMLDIESKTKLNSQTESLLEPKLCATEIPIGNDCCRVASLCGTNKNSAITNYYQISPGTIELHCFLTLLSSIMEEPCFDILRTKEGLGYYVSCTDYDTFGISGFGVSVSSSGDDYDCSFIDERIENFLTRMVEILSKMKDNTFEDHKTSVIKLKKTPDLQLNEEVSRNWTEIVSFSYCFDRLAKEIKCLERVCRGMAKGGKWGINFTPTPDILGYHTLLGVIHDTVKKIGKYRLLALRTFFW
jgi:nardilysin